VRARALYAAALCAACTGLVAATPVQADQIGSARTQAAQVWAQMQRDGQRLEVVVNRYDGARLQLARTEQRIRANETVLRVTRINLAHARQALNASLISDYKSPVPDPLEAALEARNFGQVLEQLSLLERTDSYNASTLQTIRGYRVQIVQRERVLALERRQRSATVASLQALKGHIHAAVRAERRRYDGLRAQVRRLIDARRQAEVAASRVAAANTTTLRTDAADVVAANDIGAISTGAPLPAPSSVSASAVSVALSQLGTPYVPGGAGPGGFDCSGLVSWAYAQAGHAGLPHFTGALWNSGTHVLSQSDLAPGDLVFFDGLGHVGMYIGGGDFVEAPHSGDVVKVSSLASRSDYDGAVRISG
jgi:peptidoglycan DL-endopeptidase CwlO